jgi:hypothetical protein
MTMADLSPAAQRVLDAANASATNAWSDATHQRFRSGIAAALRAAADQVQMNTPLGDTDADAGVFAAHHAIRAHFLAIATELEGNA